MAVKVGPVSAKFSGKVTLSDITPPERYRIAFEGQGGVAGFGKGEADVTLTPEPADAARSEEHTSELQSQSNLVCRLLLEKKKSTHSINALEYTPEPKSHQTLRPRVHPGQQ